MKKIILAAAVLSALPVIAIAAEHENASTSSAPEKQHTMQNSNPSPKKAEEEVKEQAPEHTMKNSDPSPKKADEEVKGQAPEHTMKNN